MKKIISASRRTDIPAFYAEWFMNRVKEGFAGYVNPFSRQKYRVSLKPENVICFVFWSKNFEPFMSSLEVLDEMGYRFCFNFTITGLPDIFENNRIPVERAIGTMKALSLKYSPQHINWRYDPIVLSDVTDEKFHLRNFENLALRLEGYAERCYFSFVSRYGKVTRNFDRFQRKHGITLRDKDENMRRDLAGRLAERAFEHGMTMYTCCGDYLIGGKIGKAHCIDGDMIGKLFPESKEKLSVRPTRKECGCTESADIGVYDSCPHGCVYCYANINREKAEEVYRRHEPETAFLGYGKRESEGWVNCS